MLESSLRNRNHEKAVEKKKKKHWPLPYSRTADQIRRSSEEQLTARYMKSLRIIKSNLKTIEKLSLIVLHCEW